MPRELAVVGFDDIADVVFLRPSLSTVRQPLDQLGAAVYRLLREPADSPRLAHVPTTFVQRDSCGCPSGGLPVSEEQTRRLFAQVQLLQTTLNTQHELGIELLGTGEHEPRTLAWLGDTPAAAQPGPAADRPAAGAPVRDPAARPRRLQGGRRLARARGGRPVADRGHPAAARPAAQVEHGGPAGWRRVRGPARRRDHPGWQDVISEAITTSLGEPFDIDGRAVQVGVSIGVAVSADGESDPDHLLREADAAMYRAEEVARRR